MADAEKTEPTEHECDCLEQASELAERLLMEAEDFSLDTRIVRSDDLILLVQLINAALETQASIARETALVANVRAVVKLITPEHITPLGKRQIERVLDEYRSGER